jgi:single-strand DNA-binding protein
MFGKAADTLAQYLTQGKEIAVDGYMKQDRWKDKNTGANREEVKHIATSVILLGGKSEGSTSDAERDEDQILF